MSAAGSAGAAPGYVIIGNCAAGIAAAEAIREIDKTTPLTMISDEVYPAYGRPLTSYILGNKVTEDQMWLRGADFYQKHNIKTMFGHRVNSVNTGDKQLILDGGGAVAYDKLLIATGGTPRRLPVPGADLTGVFYLRTLDDSRAIINHLSRTKRVLLCGGGLVTAKSMDALHHVRSVESMAMVEIMPAVLSQILDSEPAELMKSHFQENGVDVRTEISIEEVLGEDGYVTGARLKGGEVIPCEMIIVGMGVIPNTALVEGSGIETEYGIIVDDHQRTNIPDVYSAGDVTQVPDYLNGGTRLCPIWPAAFEQGRIAGGNMAGRPAAYPGGVGMNSAEFFGLPMICAGITKPGDGLEAHDRRDGDKTFRRLILRDGVLVGYVLIGDVSYAGVLTAMIRGRDDVSAITDGLLDGDLALYAAIRNRLALQVTRGPKGQPPRLPGSVATR